MNAATPPVKRENANLIIPRLWLGNANAALDENWLRANNIDVVFNCTKDIPFSSLPMKKYRLPVDDNLRDEEIRNMTLWAPETAFKILQEYYAGHNILVHCAAGMQRSAAAVAFTLIVLMYPAKHDEIIAFIKSKRPIAFTPSANFLRSIQEFEKYYHSQIQPKLQYVN